MQDGGKGGTYPGGWGSIGAVQGCPPELWTRLVGVMEIVATRGGGLGGYWVFCIRNRESTSTTGVGDVCALISSMLF